MSAKQIKKLATLLQEATAIVDQLAGGESADVAAPEVSADEIAEMKPKALKALAARYSIEEEDEDTLRELLTTLVTIKSDEDVEKDAAKALCAALGVEASKKHTENIEALKEFIVGVDGSGEEESSDEESSDDDSSDDEESSEEETEEASEEDSSDDEESEEDSEEESSDDEESEDEESSDEDEPDDDEKAERVAAYNKAAKKAKAKPVKTYADLEKLMVGDDEEQAKWGSAYVKNGEGYCCGLPLADVEDADAERPVGQCLVTDAQFMLNESQDGFDPFENSEESSEEETSDDESSDDDSSEEETEESSDDETEEEETEEEEKPAKKKVAKPAAKPVKKIAKKK